MANFLFNNLQRAAEDGRHKRLGDKFIGSGIKLSGDLDDRVCNESNKKNQCFAEAIISFITVINCGRILIDDDSLSTSLFTSTSPTTSSRLQHIHLCYSNK